MIPLFSDREVDKMYQQNYSFLDVVTILSFILQM